MAFVCTPLIIRNLGDVNYGIYVILGVIGGIFTIANLGMGDATLKYVAQYAATDDRQEIQKVFTSTFLIYALFGGMITLLLWFCPNIFVRLLKIDRFDGILQLFRITIVTFWIHLLNGCFAAIPQAVQRYEFCAFTSIFQNILQFASVFIVIRFSYGIKGLIYATFLNAVIILTLNLGIAKCLMPYIRFRWPGMDGFKKVLNYGMTIFGSQMIGLLWQHSDNIILSALIGPQAVSYFSVPMQTVGKGFGLIASGSAVLFPRFSELSSNCDENKEKIKELYVKTTQVGLFASIIMCVPLAVMIPDFLRLWISADFAKKAALVATILAASYIIRGAFLSYDALFKGLGYPRYNLYCTLASSVCILIVDLILIPIFGLKGVGFAYIVSSTIGVISIIFVFQKLLVIPMYFFWQKLAFPYCVSIAMLIILLHLKKSFFACDFGWAGFFGISIAVFLINLMALVAVCKLIGNNWSMIFNWIKK